MKNSDLLELSFGNLLRRRTRTILAIVGVVIGVCAIVVMVSIGFGLSAGFEEQIAGFGNLHTIEVYNYGGGGHSPDGESFSLDDKTIAQIEKIDGVTAITPIVNQYLNIKIGHMVTSASVVGIKPETMERFGYELEKGRLLNSTDIGNSMVFGKNVAAWFYDPAVSYGGGYGGEPTVEVVTSDIIVSGDWQLGTSSEGTGEIQYEYFEAEGVGLLASTEDETSYNVYMSIDALTKIQESILKSENQGFYQPQNGQKTYDQALIYVEDIDKIKGISDYIKETYNFSTYSLQDMLNELQQTAKMIELVLGGIGAISLFVAAIGIANTMTMSVYERTKEIGIMKVIGASISDIKKMFLVEAGMIGFIGGIFGLGLSYGISALMNTLLLPLMQDLMGGGMSKVSIIPIWVSLGALGFAAFVGILSGYLPARRAMNLSALEGLRND